MRLVRPLMPLALAAALALGVTACATDDGADVRNLDEDASGTGTGSDTGTDTGSGSDTGTGTETDS